MNVKSLEKLELNKILESCSSFAVLEQTKKALVSLLPTGDIEEVRYRLAATRECDKLLYRYGLNKIGYFPDLTEKLVRASKGSALSCAELLEVNCLLVSAREAYERISGVDDEQITIIKKIASGLYFDKRLEDDIAEKIISSEQVSDYASDALFSLRSKIKNLNERIRASLAEYASGKDSQFLQDGIVTIRNDRYVVPVKAEYKSKVKGLVHDRSQSGATFFIEPEYVLNLNNELIALSIDEKLEVERILKELSARVGKLSESLIADSQILSQIDSYYARAEYAYTKKAVCPQVNKRGYVNIVKGRHPLINKEKVVPVSVELGGDYNFLLLSGANTGGKTVTLKMIGLFCLMAECGLFIPAAEGSSVCAFEDVFCDVGDSQSIEDSLSTFSSHITNVISICDEATSDSLVLIDELGGGTNPDEGQALARAVCEHLLGVGCRGVITTHFTALKESVYQMRGIENAAMEFDNDTLKPLYSIKIGLPGASNALAISRRLGMNEGILQKAESYLSEGGRAFENIVRRAEESRIAAQRKEEEVTALQREWEKKLAEVKAAENALQKERERLGSSARAESRRIINERTAQAEQMLSELEAIFAQEEISQSDLIKARTLKNKIADEAFDGEEPTLTISNYKDVTPQNIEINAEVYVKSLQTRGVVLSFSLKKSEAEVVCGSMKLHVKFEDLQLINREKSVQNKKQKAERVKVVRKFSPAQPTFEINVIGLTVEEALIEIDNFLDKATTDNLEQVKIIHGVGTGKLRNAIAAHLKRCRHVAEYRSGKYGEGEIGVTIVTLK